MMKRLVTILLALAILMGLAAPAMAAQNSPPTIVCGKGITVTLPKDGAVSFSFIPQKTGWYWFYSVGVNCSGVWGSISSGLSGSLIADHFPQANASDHNFYVAAYMNAGEKYTLSSTDGGTYTVYIKEATKPVTGITIHSMSNQYLPIYSYPGYSYPIYLDMHPKFASPGVLSITSSNPSVAYLEHYYDGTYRMNLEVVGSAVITVTAENGVSTRLPVTVVPRPVGNDCIEFGHPSDAFSATWELRSNGLMTITGKGRLHRIDSFWGFDKNAITQVALPETPFSISSRFFVDADSLTGITIPASAECIEDLAFYNSGIRTVCFRGSAPKMEEWALEGISTVYYPAGDSSWNAIVGNDYYGNNITWKSYPTNVPGTLKKVDGVWKYYAGNVHVPMSTLVKLNGSWYYVQNGKLASNFTGFVPFNGSRYYVKNGVAMTGTTGLVKQGGVWYYIVKGKLSNATTLVKHNGEWFYIKYGTVASDVTGLVKYNGEWFYVKNGKVASKTTTLVKFNNEWFYVKNGKVASKTTTLVKYNGSWYYIYKGKVASQTTTLVKFSDIWYYVRDGKVDLSYNGTFRFNGGTYQIRNGRVSG